MTVHNQDFPFTEKRRFDSWGEAKKAGWKDSQIWSVTCGDDEDNEDGIRCSVFLYGPPHHYVNHLYHVVTDEHHDDDTYYEEYCEMEELDDDDLY